MILTLIQNPPYTVDMSQYAPAKKEEAPASCWESAQKIHRAIFSFLQAFVVSIARSGYSTLSTAGISFKYVVLGKYGDYKLRVPMNVTLVALKIVVWFAGLVWCFASTTCRLTYQQLRGAAVEHMLLDRYAGDEINPQHIRCNNTAIDMTGVSEAATVNSLVDIFNNINFTDENAPGYMKESCRKEGNTTYTVEQLQEGLHRFIEHVNGRVAFTGTPPAHDMPRLLAFYAQIENGVRFSIHKANQALQDFQAKNGNQPENYSAPQMREYKNLLENKARIAINLAIAGKHCGARFMGESMELYDSFNAESNMLRGSLDDTLIDLLSAKRKEIALAQIQTHLARHDPDLGNLGVDTHDYNNYMSNMGQLLALPGTENIIEHLVNTFDRPLFLQRFFQEYTVDAIVNAIQEKILTSNDFREKITDWLRDQAGNWGQEPNAELLGQLIEKGNEVVSLQELQENDPRLASLQQLQAIVAHLKEQKIDLSALQAPNCDVPNELFALESVKEWCKTNISPNVVQRSQKTRLIKELFEENFLGGDLRAAVLDALTSDQPFTIDRFREKLLVLYKTSALLTATSIETDGDEPVRIPYLNTALAAQVVAGHQTLQNALAAYHDQNRKFAFLGELHLGNIATEGLPTEILEWIAVSHGILLPQQQGAAQ